MSNRRRPTRPDLSLHTFRVVQNVDAVLANPAVLRCPDCDSTLGEPVRHADQLVSIQVLHDDACPWYRAHTA